MEVPDDFDPAAPIAFSGSTTEVAKQLAAGLQGVHLALETSTGLQAQDPERIGTGAGTSGPSGPGSARFGRLIERRDELAHAIRRATRRLDDEAVTLWKLARFGQKRDDGWRPATYDEAAEEAGLDVSRDTVHRRVKSVDEAIDKYVKKQGWRV